MDQIQSCAKLKNTKSCQEWFQQEYVSNGFNVNMVAVGVENSEGQKTLTDNHIIFIHVWV